MGELATNMSCHLRSEYIFTREGTHQLETSKVARRKENSDSLVAASEGRKQTAQTGVETMIWQRIEERDQKARPKKVQAL